MRVASAVVVSALVIVACSKKPPPAEVDAGAPALPDATAPAASAPPSAARLEDGAAPSAAGPCPEDMAYVDTMFCSDPDRECVDVEHEHPNNLTICHKFDPAKNGCKSTPERRQFCIDRYEYPNQKGAHPVWMLTWTQAQATCESKGKRLCWASEWTAACEGPDHTPFPYGWVRDHDKCNIDNFFVDPRKGGGNFLFYSKDKAVADEELARLDESVPSGSLAECTNGFGVYDTTGNMDEWVTSDRKAEDKSKWAGLKGGAWGHVRNQCRPMTTSHEPEFWYYFVSFRCCKDAEGAPAWKPSGPHDDAPAVEPHDFAPEPIVPKNPHGPSKTKYGQKRQ